MIVEIVGCSVEDALAIERAGADRIELCAGIVAGGVTPSCGLLREVKAACTLPIMVMIRPREGGFFYSDAEFDTMKREMDALGECGADGFVFGILRPDGSVDAPRVQELRERAPNHPVMCHRAFDVTPDPLAAIDALVDAGFDRVLSSGQRREIVAGIPKLREIMAHAKGRVDVQPCEGIRPENVTQVIESLNPSCIHLGPFISVIDPTSSLGSEVHYGAHLCVDETCVREVVRLARQGSNQVFS